MIKRFRASLSVCALLLFCSVSLAASLDGFDIVIVNGHIIDGAGSPWYSGDIGIRGGKIAAIGNLSDAPRTRTIDAQGKVVAPGFIDMLGQSELTILVDPRLPSKIYQGITTEVTGEGISAAPLNDAIIRSDRGGYEHYHITPDWRTLGQYFARLEKQGIGINLASYVGATQVRRMILGDDDKQPTPEQLEQMKELVRQAMRDGAVGVSTSLEYAPAPYAKTEELIALASEASKFGGIYATHMRNESDAVLPAIDEALRIGREAHIPVEIWHIKVAGKENWGRMPEVVAKINAARAEGADISANTYAYTAWFNSLSAFIPQWAHDGGDAKLIERLKDPATRVRIRKEMMTPSQEWDNEWQEIPGPESILIGVVQNPQLLPLQGKTLADIAKIWNKDPMDALFDLLIEDKAFTEVAVFGMSEPDVALAFSSRGFPSTTIPPAHRRKEFWGRSIRIRARTAHFHGFFESMCEKKRSSVWKTQFASFLHCRRSGCVSPIGECLKPECGRISSFLTPLRFAIWRLSTIQTNCQREWITF